MFSRVTRNIAGRILNSALIVASAAILTAQTPAPAPTVLSILKARAASLAAMHLHPPQSHETVGTLSGLGLNGSFHEWQDGEKQRRDERLGIRTQRELRVGDSMWIENASGEIRELHGLIARRQLTADFIVTGSLLEHPEYAHFVGRTKLPDGRDVYELDVTPPTGETYRLALDAKTYMIDCESYVDHDRTQTVTYDDYHVVDGMLVPYLEIDSGGDARYALTSRVTSVTVDHPIADDVFAPLAPAVVDTTKPVTVPVDLSNGLPFVTVTVGDHQYSFLLDSGSQGTVIDPRVSRDLGLHPEGALEINGAARTASQGVVQMPPMSIGGVAIPARIASVVDLSHILGGLHPVDGVLGYPFFASAEVRFDPDSSSITIGKPGSLPSRGGRLRVDTDRELAEVEATIDGNVPTRLVVDTGNSNELLLFRSFIDAHEGVVSLANGHQLENRGVGGSTVAISAMVDELQLGSYRLFNRYADIILASAGAFADRNDGGNVGFAVLRNFVTTFDLANRALYLDPAHRFDDGRFRQRFEGSGIISLPAPP